MAYVCVDILAMSPFAGLVTDNKDRKTKDQILLPGQAGRNDDATSSAPIALSIAGKLNCTFI